MSGRTGCVFLEWNQYFSFKRVGDENTEGSDASELRYPIPHHCLLPPLNLCLLHWTFDFPTWPLRLPYSQLSIQAKWPLQTEIRSGHGSLIKTISIKLTPHHASKVLPCSKSVCPPNLCILFPSAHTAFHAESGCSCPVAPTPAISSWSFFLLPDMWIPLSFTSGQEHPSRSSLS